MLFSSSQNGIIVNLLLSGENKQRLHLEIPIKDYFAYSGWKCVVPNRAVYLFFSKFPKQLILIRYQLEVHIPHISDQTIIIMYFKRYVF